MLTDSLALNNNQVPMLHLQFDFPTKCAFAVLIMGIAVFIVHTYVTVMKQANKVDEHKHTGCTHYGLLL